jgi:hypothetical protein
VASRCVLNVGIEEGVILSAENKKRIVKFSAIVGNSKFVSLDFVVVTAPKTKFEMPSEMKTGSAESCRTGNSIKEL